MSVAVELDWSGEASVQAMLGEFSGAPLNNRIKRALRAGLRPIREEMRTQGRQRHDLPRTFSKTRTRAHRTPTAVSVSPVSPLAPIFEHGADSHVIAPHGAGLLAGRAGQHGRARAFVAAGAVDHPGMAARPFIAPVFEASKDRAQSAFGDALFSGLPR